MSKEILEIMKPYHDLRTATIKQDVELELRKYLKHRPSEDMFFTIEVEQRGSYLFVLAHYGCKETTIFGCAYFKACYCLSSFGNEIFKDVNVLDKPHYTMTDVISNTKHYVNTLHKEIKDL